MIGLREKKKRKTPAKATERIRVNIDVSVDLLKRATQAVLKGAARSRNGLIVKALEEYLKRLEDSWIDAEFERMIYDEKYTELNLRVAEEFDGCDREALRMRNK